MLFRRYLEIRCVILKWGDFSQLAEGAFGVMEPIVAEIGRNMKFADESAETKHVNNDRMVRPVDWRGKDTLVLTPGVAFDRYGNRMGFGKGYYDRYFAERNRYNLLGVAYELQVSEELPTGEFDVALPYIVTECGMIQGT